MAAAQVSVRLGETLLDVRCLGAGERYWVGTAPGVDLGAHGLGAFPLVEVDGQGVTVRAPVGTPLALGAHRVAGTGAAEVRVAAGDVARLELGLATVEIRLVESTGAPLPRPAPELRTAAFVTASLLAHVTVWAIAAIVAPYTGPTPRQPRPHLVAIRDRKAPPPRPTTPPPPLPPPLPQQLPSPPSPQRHSAAAAAAATRTTPARTAPALHESASAPQRVTAAEFTAARQQARAAGREAAGPMTAAFATLAAALGSIHISESIESVGPLYRPDEAPGFGAQHAFDPETRPGFERIQTGHFETASNGAGVGDGYISGDPARPAMSACASGPCTASGALTDRELRATLRRHLDRLRDCGDGAHHGVSLALDLDASGTVSAIHGTAPDAVERCAETIVARIAFPAARGTSHATVSLDYERGRARPLSTNSR